MLESVKFYWEAFQKTSKGVSTGINAVIALLLALFIGAVFLTIALPVLSSQGDANQCTGPGRAIASILADMTGLDTC